MNTLILTPLGYGNNQFVLRIQSNHELYKNNVLKIFKNVDIEDYNNRIIFYHKFNGFVNQLLNKNLDSSKYNGFNNKINDIDNNRIICLIDKNYTNQLRELFTTFVSKFNDSLDSFSKNNKKTKTNRSEPDGGNRREKVLIFYDKILENNFYLEIPVNSIKILYYNFYINKNINEINDEVQIHLEEINKTNYELCIIENDFLNINNVQYNYYNYILSNNLNNNNHEYYKLYSLSRIRNISVELKLKCGLFNNIYIDSDSNNYHMCFDNSDEIKKINVFKLNQINKKNINYILFNGKKVIEQRCSRSKYNPIEFFKLTRSDLEKQLVYLLHNKQNNIRLFVNNYQVLIDINKLYEELATDDSYNLNSSLGSVISDTDNDDDFDFIENGVYPINNSYDYMNSMDEPLNGFNSVNNMYNGIDTVVSCSNSISDNNGNVYCNGNCQNLYNMENVDGYPINGVDHIFSNNTNCSHYNFNCNSNYNLNCRDFEKDKLEVITESILMNKKKLGLLLKLQSLSSGHQFNVCFIYVLLELYSKLVKLGIFSGASFYPYPRNQKYRRRHSSSDTTHYKSIKHQSVIDDDNPHVKMISEIDVNKINIMDVLEDLNLKRKFLNDKYSNYYNIQYIFYKRGLKLIYKLLVKVIHFLNLNNSKCYRRNNVYYRVKIKYYTDYRNLSINHLIKKHRHFNNNINNLKLSEALSKVIHVISCLYLYDIYKDHIVNNKKDRNIESSERCLVPLKIFNDRIIKLINKTLYPVYYHNNYKCINYYNNNFDRIFKLNIDDQLVGSINNYIYLYLIGRISMDLSIIINILYVDRSTDYNNNTINAHDDSSSSNSLVNDSNNECNGFPNGFNNVDCNTVSSDTSYRGYKILYTNLSFIDIDLKPVRNIYKWKDNLLNLLYRNNIL